MPLSFPSAYQDYGVSITMPGFREQDVTPVALPTSEPETPQISYTVLSGDLPSVTGRYKSFEWLAGIFGGGRNSDGASRTVYWRTKKNGNNVGMGSSSVSNNYYYTVNAWVCDVVVGDVITLSLWCPTSTGNVDYRWDGFRIALTRLFLCDCPALLSKLDSSATSVQAEAPFVLGVSPSYSSGTCQVFHINYDYSNFTFTTPSTVGPGQHHSTYGVLRAYYGDSQFANSGTIRSHSSYMPFWYRNQYPTYINIRRHVRIPSGLYLP